MKLHRLGALVVVPALLIAASGIAHAQIRYLPASEYDRINVRVPQAVVSQYSELSQRNVFERIERFKASDRYRRAGRPIGRLMIRMKDEQGRYGTAMCTVSIVSAQYLLTNHHCIPGEIGLKVLGAKAEFDYLDAKNTAEVRSYPVDIRPVETSVALDYSILRVHGDPAATFGTIIFATHPASVRDSIFIIGYPEGQPETLSRKDCYVQVVKPQEFTHSCDTLPGSSGSPVFSDETFHVIGLHYAGGQEGNFAKRIGVLMAHSRLLASVAKRATPGGESVAVTPHSQLTIALNSDPSGAAVFNGKTLLGLTPLSFAVAREGNYIFRLKKDGFADASVTVDGHQGNVQRTVRLRPNGTASVKAQGVAPAPIVVDPATAQARRALAFWRQMEGSGLTDKAPDQQPSGNAGAADRAGNQQSKADAMFKAFGQ